MDAGLFLIQKKILQLKMITQLRRIQEDSTSENDNAVEKETNDEESKTIDEIHEGQIDISCLYNEIQNSLVSSFPYRIKAACSTT